jgi:hypothetical protein
MTRSVKLADLDIRETSGVDHPAHLHEGWLVLKSATEGGDTTEGEQVELEVTETAEVVEAEVTEVAASVDNSNSELLKELGDLRKELADMRAEKESIEREAALAKAVETAHEFAGLPGVDPQALGEDLLKMRGEMPEVAARVEDILKQTALAFGEAGVLKEIGSDSNDAEGSAAADAWGIIESRANDLVASGEAASLAKAITLVAERDIDLYNTYLTEKGL